MAHPLRKLYPRAATTALTFQRRPAVLGAWDQQTGVFAAAGARYMGPLPGAAQQAVTPPFVSIPNGTTKTLCCLQVMSDPLKQQIIAAGTWTVAFAARLANAGASFTWGGAAALYVVSSTGARRGTIFNVTAIGSAGRTATTERTCLADVAGAKVAVQTGDCLVLELGLAVTNTGGATAPQASLYADGATVIGADDAATTDAQTALLAPQDLPLSLPQAGEQPEASVSRAQVVALIREHFPPGSDSLYDWHDAATTINHLVEWLADALKVYGYDQVDRIIREISPLTCVEQMAAWEALLGVTHGVAAQVGLSIEARRQAVLARIRESGPLTLFNAASVVAAMAGYTGSLPPILEITSTDLRGANTVADVVGDAVPTGVGFDDAANLVRMTPVLLDGGHCQNAGALVGMAFDATDTEGVHIRLTAPDGTFVERACGPSLNTTIALRMGGFAGCPVHGAWKLNVWRSAGAPAVTLNGWTLYCAGQGYGGRGQAHWNWMVHLDPSHRTQTREVQDYLDRATQMYARSWILYSLTSSPGTDDHRAGWFIPGT